MSKKEGKCRICGNECKLTFEHIPPKNSFNNERVKIITGNNLIEHIAKEDELPWDYSNVKYNILQKGTGLYSLCERCNNLTGTFYGTEYKKMVYTIENLFTQNKDPDYLSFFAKGVKVLNFIKQVVSCICSTCTSMRKVCTNIENYMLDKECREIGNNEIKLYMYILKEPVVLWTREQAFAKGNDICLIAELDLGRIGFIIDLKGNYICHNELTNITKMISEFEYDKEYDIELSLPIVEKNIFFAGDFRKKEEIEPNYEE